MDCRTFRERHPAFLDAALSRGDALAMQAHAAECSQCAQYDTAVRRGLLVFRNLPPIKPSPGFGDRLNARLRELERRRHHELALQGPGLGSFLVIATGMLVAGVMAASFWSGVRQGRIPTLSPVVATRPAMTVPAPVVSSGFLASASVGLPVWPAAVIAEQAPTQFLNVEMDQASDGR